jgi:hypothetical protein
MTAHHSRTVVEKFSLLFRASRKKLFDISSIGEVAAGEDKDENFSRATVRIQSPLK